MEHMEKSKIAASDINYYIQARLGTLSDLSYSSDILLLPNDFLDGADLINPYAMELSDALISHGYKALMAIGPKVQQGKKRADEAILPHVLIMNTYKEKEILSAIADWIESADMPKEKVTITIMLHDAALVAYPANTYSGTADEVSGLLKG